MTNFDGQIMFCLLSITKIARTLRYKGYLVTGHADLQAIKLNNFQPFSFSKSVVYKYIGNEQHHYLFCLKFIFDLIFSKKHSPNFR